MSKNGNIKSFFKPAPKDSQLPQSQTSQTSLTPAPIPRELSIPPEPSSSPLSVLLSSPPAPAGYRSRDAVIPGSDDEGDDDISSDDDLPDMFARPSNISRIVPAPAKPVMTNPCVTPRAKRRAIAMHSSPLTINAKHRFDFKALVKHANVDGATEASHERAWNLTRRSESPDEVGTLRKPLEALDENMLDVCVVEPKGKLKGKEKGHERRKLFRAVERAEANTQRPQWHFFSQDQSGARRPTDISARLPFPSQAATGNWAFLESANGRNDFFEDGIPFCLQKERRDLPDEIFLWVLNEIPREKSKILRAEYLKLVGLCLDQARRCVDEELITQLFRKLGASEEGLASDAELHPNYQKPHRYRQSNWTRLRSVLRILVEIAQGLHIQALCRAVSILLRLGIDTLLLQDCGVNRDFHDAFHELARAVPQDNWDTFCEEACMSVYLSTEEACLRWNAVSSIPVFHPRLVDLRRRLALVCIFNDPTRGRSHPETTFDMHAVINRIDADDFIVDREITDFFALAALIGLLGIAMGDGHPPPSDAPAAVRQYNADVDEITGRVKDMWTSIQETGAAYVSRLEVKQKLQDLDRKLQLAIRTVPPPKRDVFGINKTSEDDVARPKQQAFMKKFLNRARPTAMSSPSLVKGVPMKLTPLAKITPPKTP
ncbi:hypothetical protein QBC46DRAFT_390308 [Diplogelasinospora grovesii]|uniref:Uncharacterized protein n=1 Tax=Diplogelasinospora grovesii TaxID=303347 RepID=A0AAN6S3A1_9PEZI|nr:hypothetical protein QBC46DRAFT_390308 [Diplogelasinospora grovesii]